jgi:hypothetical protein
LEVLEKFHGSSCFSSRSGRAATRRRAWVFGYVAASRQGQSNNFGSTQAPPKLRNDYFDHTVIGNPADVFPVHKTHNIVSTLVFSEHNHARVRLMRDAHQLSNCGRMQSNVYARDPNECDRTFALLSAFCMDCTHSHEQAMCAVERCLSAA